MRIGSIWPVSAWIGTVLVELADWRVEFELKIDLQLAQDRHELACIDKDEQIGRERERED